MTCPRSKTSWRGAEHATCSMPSMRRSQRGSWPHERVKMSIGKIGAKVDEELMKGGNLGGLF